MQLIYIYFKEEDGVKFQYEVYQRIEDTQV